MKRNERQTFEKAHGIDGRGYSMSPISAVESLNTPSFGVAYLRI